MDLGLLGNIVVGIIGGLIAGWLLPKAGLFQIGGGILGAIIYSAIGAVILLLIIGLIAR